MANKARSPHSGMTHLNGNLLCVIDVETTGLVPGYHDIWQLSILPLDNSIRPLQSVMPFYINLKLKYPERADPQAIKIATPEFARLQQHAIDPWKAVDLFETWFEQLKLPQRKRLMPLGQNWVYDRSHVMEWLGGPLSFDHFFHFHYRDTMAAALFINDRSDQFCEKIPFPQVGLGELCTRTQTLNLKAHDALQDCVATAEVYRKLLIGHMPGTGQDPVHRGGESTTPEA